MIADSDKAPTRRCEDVRMAGDIKSPARLKSGRTLELRKYTHNSDKLPPSSRTGVMHRLDVKCQQSSTIQNRSHSNIKKLDIIVINHKSMCEYRYRARVLGIFHY